MDKGKRGQDLKKMPFWRYKSFPTVKLSHRKWPANVFQRAPIWCSVDLRDGNQALVNPMSVEQKLIFFDKLVDIGFKEIEVGFPAASVTEHQFLRKLIEENRIPNDVTIQVLCQARPALIAKTIESLQGVKNAIFHLYNSTSTLQREVVFSSDKAGVKKIAVDATFLVKQEIKKLQGSNIRFQYSPESFTTTELDYALEIVEEVVNTWQADSEDKEIIINLPATVEVCSPNIYADMIEWFGDNLLERDKIILSVHTHNDRGCAVAATELAILAGADRVEGTLFGNGERTGNVDIVTLACNLYSQGIDPELNFTSMDNLVKLYSQITNLDVHPRHPYAGDLVYTAFSGSHQDAIKKGITALKNRKDNLWDVPYLAIDPKDLGRVYEPVRINSQSGKGGIAFILEHKFGYQLPRKFHAEVSQLIQSVSEKTGKEVDADTIKKCFEAEFLNIEQPLALKNFEFKHINENLIELGLSVISYNNNIALSGEGNGPIDALTKILKLHMGIDFEIEDYVEHTLSYGSSAKAACYINSQFGSQNYLGLGSHVDTNRASFLALFSSLNRYLKANTSISSAIKNFMNVI